MSGFSIPGGRGRRVKAYSNLDVPTVIGMTEPTRADSEFDRTDTEPMEIEIGEQDDVRSVVSTVNSMTFLIRKKKRQLR